MREFVRKKTRVVMVGDVAIGGDNPVVVQSMTSTRTEDIEGTLEQIERLYEAGGELIRVAVPNFKAVEAFREIVRSSPIPVIADIHFNYKLAIAAMEAGASKIRINPGNIGGYDKVKEVIAAARSNDVPIRIGVNSGSLELDLIDKHGGVTPEAMVESAVRWVRFFEDQGFDKIVVSVKGSSVPATLRAYRMISDEIDYPLHLGITEAGPAWTGTIKSAVGIGTLLAEGIGDTIRVSLTADPVEEVKVAWEILKSLELRSRGIMLISCPTCARTRIDLMDIVGKIERRLSNIKAPIRVAVMGCEVNGPGEARDADIGIAAGPGFGLLFKKGKVVRKVPESDIVDELVAEVEKMAAEMESDNAV